MDSITIKKMVPKFDTDAINSGLPYRITLNGKVYLGVFSMINEDRLEYKYFNEDGEIKFAIILPSIEHIEISPFSLSSEVNIELPELKKNEIPVVSKEDVPVESVGPDIKKFYIANNVFPLKNEPLFILKDDKWVINAPIIRKYLDMKNILVRVDLGAGEYNTDAYAVFPPECIEINSDENLLCCIDKSVKCGYTLKSIYINSYSWKHLNGAYIEIVNKDWYEGEI
jgi:hypothetical protein